MRNSGVDPTDLLGWMLPFAEYGALRPRLWLRNRTSTEPVIGTGAANVSLTSYGKRISTVWQTIETIGAGTVKPRRLILWLDDRDTYHDPPATLKRLQTRGLEIRHCRDYGPHKKYFPYVKEILADEPDRTLVTADDDVYYPPNWLAELLAAHRPGEVTGFRARMRNDEPYSSWPMCTTTEASETVFATGVSGVAYPPELLRTLRDRGDAFAKVCPRADDYWLHYAAVSTGIPIRQVRDVAAYFWPIFLVANRGLWDGSGTANDAIAVQAKNAWLGPRDSPAKHSSTVGCSSANRAKTSGYNSRSSDELVRIIDVGVDSEGGAC
ncbi:hypothetical protein [Mycolicibacterium llatzerense]|uniref:hypothetical protein n=1 Tax=Mycolicibacterium llatzerense TaxID=280871 RepID=UPI000A9C3F39|nr:hypothetical protein [Mycolicibacterium llatzerense]